MIQYDYSNIYKFEAKRSGRNVDIQSNNFCTLLFGKYSVKMFISPYTVNYHIVIFGNDLKYKNNLILWGGKGVKAKTINMQK